MKKTYILAALLTLLSFPALATVDRIDPNAMEVTPTGSSTSDTLADWLFGIYNKNTNPHKDELNIIAHRGYLSVEPQNTIRAFRRAISDGAKVLEMDVMISSDGVPVVFHDSTLDSITDCSGNLKDLTAAAIISCNIDNPGGVPSITGIPAGDLHIPTFQSVVELAAKTRTKIMPEIKGFRTQNDISLMVDVVEQANMSNLTTWQCSSLSDCSKLRSLVPTARIAYFGTASTLANMQSEIDSLSIYNGNVEYFNTSANYIAHPEIISYAMDRNITVNAYTATSISDIQTLGSLGIANIFSDIPYHKNSGENSNSIRNVFYGNNSLLAATATDSGITDNTAFGYNALRSPGYTATNSTAIGALAMESAGTSSFSTAVGYASCQNVASTSNVCIGSQAGRYVAATSHETAVGAGALIGNTASRITGGDNTAIGFSSLGGVITNGSNNTAIGSSSGLSITTGDNNVIVGYQVAKTVLTTGSNNILIGTSSLVDTTASGDSNVLKIGGGATPTISATNINTTTPPVTINGTLSVVTGGSTNHAVCWKAGGTLGYCSAVVAADGTCGTCN